LLGELEVQVQQNMELFSPDGLFQSEELLVGSPQKDLADLKIALLKLEQEQLVLNSTSAAVIPF
jgi:hypothetical protein